MTNLNRIRNNQLTYLKVFRSSYLTNNIQDLDILPQIGAIMLLRRNSHILMN